MSIIAWIVLGAIAGYLAGLFVTGDEGLGIIGHIVLGIVGALVGGFLASVLFNTKPIDGALRHELDRGRHDRRDHRGPRRRCGHPGLASLRLDPQPRNARRSGGRFFMSGAGRRRRLPRPGS